MSVTTEVINPEPEDDKASFFEFAETLPETAEGFLSDGASPSGNESILEAGTQVGGSGGVQEQSTTSAPERERKTIELSKKMRKTMNKFKGKAAEFPIMWFHQKAKTRPEWELDKEEEDLLKDSISTVFDILDIEVQIQPLTWTLQSIWWVIGYPILAFIFLFLTKKNASMEKDKADALQQQN